jgi:putative transcriptional regulator
MAITGTIHNTVAKHRLAKSITQEVLAEASGVTRQTIIALEKGNYVPSVLLAIRIAEYFNQPVEKLFFYE